VNSRSHLPSKRVEQRMQRGGSAAESRKHGRGSRRSLRQMARQE
jgi:hypothetical protein